MQNLGLQTETCQKIVNETDRRFLFLTNLLVAMLHFSLAVILSDMRFPTMWYVLPAMGQTRLRHT